MRLQLTLLRTSTNAALTLNYLYPLSAAIYKIMETADADYATFLHQAGYGRGQKRFKLFTFSALRTPFRIQGDRLVMLEHEASLQICFHLPRAAEAFVRGLFQNRELTVADSRSKVSFTISSVAALADELPEANEHGLVRTVLQPLSPLVVGRKNSRGHYDYRSPEDADYVQWLVHNWLEKQATVYEPDPAAAALLQASIRVSVQRYRQPPQCRLITIKQGTPAETRVKGYLRFGLAVEAPRELLELALGAGLGLYNAMGCGCVGIEKRKAAEAAKS